jgi:hypothetical protein
LWLVDGNGRRLEKAVRHLQIPGERLVVPAGSEIERSFELSAADLNGEPFDQLTLFLDEGATIGSQRLPSTPVRVSWTIDRAELIELLNDAAGGAATGMRNPSLKLLRQYLESLHALLRNTPDDAMITDRARELKQQLELAGCLKPLAPGPGQVFLPVQPGPDGRWILALPDATCESLSDGGLTEKLGRIVGVRRHLGWDINLETSPETNTTISEIQTLAARLAPLRDQLAGQLVWRVPQASGTVTNTIQFHRDIPAADAQA